MNTYQGKESFKYRIRPVGYFFTLLNLGYGKELKQYLEDELGASTIEDLKNVDEEDWKYIKKILHMKRLQ